ncbi:hypothetical protein ACFV6B_36675 [Streptomyces microflavus]|uniref:hypothetical protein n=1 Tax=Streptomyces microflavus TaxID=1919 RepID=UPI00364BB618
MSPLTAAGTDTYIVEVTAMGGRWSLSITDADLEIVVGPVIDLGPVGAFAPPRPGAPGRYLTAVHALAPVPLHAEASRLMRRHGFAVTSEALADRRTDEGWTQIGVAMWMAPCRRSAS